MQELNAQKKILKSSGITVDGRHYDIKFTGIVFIYLYIYRW